MFHKKENIPISYKITSKSILLNLSSLSYPLKQLSTNPHTRQAILSGKRLNSRTSLREIKKTMQYFEPHSSLQMNASRNTAWFFYFPF